MAIHPYSLWSLYLIHVSRMQPHCLRGLWRFVPFARKHVSNHWATLTFDLAFRWAKVRSKYRLKSKSKVLSAKDLGQIYGLSPDFCVQLKVSLSERLSQKLKSPTVFVSADQFVFQKFDLCILCSFHCW